MQLGATIPFYRRLASPLHAARATVSATWALALVTAALLCDSPIALGALLLAVLGAAAGARVEAQIMRALRAAALVTLPIVLVNVLVSRQGLTVFARLGDLGPFGQGDLTYEALAYGGLIALKLTAVIVIASLAGLTVDPDELLRVLRRLSYRTALTASIATRMLPLLAADAQRLADAQRTRPDASARRARTRLALLSAVVGGSVDRAMDVAATLEVRGVAAALHPPRGAVARRALSRHDLAFAVSALAIIALAVLARLSGEVAFEPYPITHMPAHGATIAFALALVLAALAPFADRRGIER